MGDTEGVVAVVGGVADDAGDGAAVVGATGGAGAGASVASGVATGAAAAGAGGDAEMTSLMGFVGFVAVTAGVVATALLSVDPGPLAPPQAASISEAAQGASQSGRLEAQALAARPDA